MALPGRVVEAAERVLAEERAVAPLDVLRALGWVHPGHEDPWRQGRTPHLSPLATVRAEKLDAVLDTLREWAVARGLVPDEIPYVDRTRHRRPLRFTAGGGEAVERALRTHWISGGLPEQERERVVAKRSRPPELVVISPVRDWTCTECGGTGDLLVMEDPGPLCLTCADLDMLVFLPAGDATLTRRARAGSTLAAVVVRWSRTRRRYERQGLLVEEPALRAAEERCLADADARARARERARERTARQDDALVAAMTARIRELLAGCPPERAAAIAAHTGLRGSGRVGRSTTRR